MVLPDSAKLPDIEDIEHPWPACRRYDSIIHRRLTREGKSVPDMTVVEIRSKTVVREEVRLVGLSACLGRRVPILLAIAEKLDLA
jgi:hypothetical protein